MSRRAQAVNLENYQLVQRSPGFPSCFEATRAGLDLAEWAASQKQSLEQHLAEDGALLFRGFAMTSPAQLEAFARGFCSDLYGDYAELPKSTGQVYTSTPYPQDHSIFFHNEGAHRSQCPARQWFACLEPAATGGETLLADGRAVQARLDPAYQQKLRERGFCYVRRFQDHLEGGWKSYFRQSDAARVEEECAAAGIRTRWKDGLLTIETRSPAVLQNALFSQVLLHHPRFLSPEVCRALGPVPPRAVTYGDGSELEEELLVQLEEAYRVCARPVAWQAGDVVMVDNLRVAHARAPYTGSRRLLVALGDRQSLRSLWPSGIS